MHRPAILLIAVIGSGCYSSYARTSDGGADAVEPPDAPCALVAWDRVVEVGIDVPTRTHHHFDIDWAGGSYIMVWDDRTDSASSVWFTRISGGGDPLGAVTLASGGSPEASPVNPRVAWSGSVVGISWETYDPPQVVRLGLFDRDGAPIGSSAILTDSAPGHVWGLQSVMAWTGEHFAAAWPYEVEGPNAEGIAARFVEESGSVAGEPVTFSEGFTGHPDIQGAAGRAALLWQGASSYITLFDELGTIAGQGAYSTGPGMGRHLAVGPAGFGVVWSDDGFFFSRLGSDAAVLVPAVRLADTNAGVHSADTAWTAWGWAVAWQIRYEDPEGLPAPIRLVILGDDGGILFDETLGSVVPEGVSEVHVAWTGSELGVMWNGRDLDVPVDSLLFTKILCP